MKKYYIHTENEQQGPFDLAEMAGVGLTKDTPVWYEGLSGWTPAGELPELHSLFHPGVPPPFNPASKRKDRTKGLLGWFVLLVVLTLGVYASVLFLQRNLRDGKAVREKESTLTSQRRFMTVEEMEKANPARYLKAEGTYKKNLWGGKFKLKCEIKNTASKASYRDAVIRVTYYSNTKAPLGTREYTVNERFPPNSTKEIKLKVESMKDAESVEWTVVRAVSL